MTTFPPYPIPVHTPLGDGWVVYVTGNGMNENDEITVALAADGQWRHFKSSDVKSGRNATYGVAQPADAIFDSPIEALRNDLDSIVLAVKNDLRAIREEITLIKLRIQ